LFDFGHKQIKLISILYV